MAARLPAPTRATQGARGQGQLCTADKPATTPRFAPPLLARPKSGGQLPALGSQGPVLPALPRQHSSRDPLPGWAGGLAHLCLPGHPPRPAGTGSPPAGAPAAGTSEPVSCLRTDGRRTPARTAELRLCRERGALGSHQPRLPAEWCSQGGTGGYSAPLERVGSLRSPRAPRRESLLFTLSLRVYFRVKFSVRRRCSELGFTQ